MSKLSRLGQIGKDLFGLASEVAQEAGQKIGEVAESVKENAPDLLNKAEGALKQASDTLAEKGKEVINSIGKDGEK